jgi:hypothetical protein
MSLLFLFKISIPPILVALMSIGARIFGPTIGGLFMGLPWMTGPVLYFLAVDKGDAFAVQACTGIELGVLAIVAYIIGYGAVAHYTSWPLSILIAALYFLAVGWFLGGIPMPLWLATLGAIASLLALYALLPKPSSLPKPVPLPWWDIPARMLSTFILVAGIMTTADQLGPQLSGIASTFPVITTVIGIFTHSQRGLDALLAMFRGLTLSMLGFCVFFLIVGYGIPLYGTIPAFAIAAATGVTISALMIGINRLHARRVRKRARS